MATIPHPGFPLKAKSTINPREKKANKKRRTHKRAKNLPRFPPSRPQPTRRAGKSLGPPFWAASLDLWSLWQISWNSR
jgi:hypothetical protein